MIELDEEEKTDARAYSADALRAEPLRRRTPYLTVIHGTFGLGKTFKVEGMQVIGRKSCEIQLEDPSISRAHARLSFPEGAGGKVVLEDLGSTNGTFQNGKRVQRAELSDGDKIQVGNSTILKFSFQDALDEALQRELYASVTRDFLTGLYNKRYLLDVLAKEYAYAARHQVPLSLLMLDVDHFKRVNDTHGHPVGDLVLKHVARRVADIVRVEDAVARFGGEEFTVLLRETSARDAVICGERIRLGVDASRLEHQGQVLHVTLSVGVATFEASNVASGEALLALADGNLYRAKKAGRNRVVGGPSGEK